MPADKYYHISNEARENELLFKDSADYSTFLKYLTEYLNPPIDPSTVKKSFTVQGKVFHGVPHMPKNYYNKIGLVAYSLNDNKFNLLLKEMDQGKIELFIRSLSTRYSIYFNKKYSRSGPVFKGPYKSVEVNKGHELTLLIHHIHDMGGQTSLIKYAQSSEFKKYTLTEDEKQKVEQKIFKKAPNIAEVIQNSEQAIQDNVEKVSKYLKIHQRVPELVFASLLLVTLAALGYRNIMLSQTVGVVAGAKTENVTLDEFIFSHLNINKLPNQ